MRRQVGGGRPERGRLGVGPRALAAILSVAVVAYLASCQSAARIAGSSVQVLGSWTGSEADAFQAVVRPFEERTGIRVDYTTTRDLHGAIDDGLASGHPPDLTGLDGPTHLRELAGRGVLKDLGGAIDLQQYKQSVAPTFVEFGSVNGQLLGVFLKATLKGLIWYDPSVFRQGTPASFSDLQWMSDRYLTGQTHEWCVGLSSRESSGWPGTDIIESFLIHQSGVDAYDSWVSGDLPWTSTEVRSAFQAYGQVVANDAVHGGATGAIDTAFEDAGDPLFTVPPGCLFLHQGSFMPAFFEAKGLKPGVAFDFFPFPDINSDYHGSVIGGGDLFGMLTGNRAAAELLRYLVSPEAQTILVSSGGALSVDKRVSSYPNDLVEREASLLTGAKRFRFDASDLMPVAVTRAFYAAVLEYTADQTKLEEVLQEMERVSGGNRGG